MTFRKATKRATILSLFLGILLASSVAFAWWTASGTGNGYAKSETGPAAVYTNVVAPTAQLHPGGSADVELTIRNPNAYAVTVTDIADSVATTITSGNATCDNPDALATPAYLGNGVSWVSDRSGTWTVPAASGGTDGTLSVTLTNAVSMSNTADTANNACQAKTFTVSALSLTAHT